MKELDKKWKEIEEREIDEYYKSGQYEKILNELNSKELTDTEKCLVPLTGLLLKINNLYYNKLKYLTKDFNSLSIKIEKELWEEFYYMDQLEQLQPLELRLKNSTTLKNLKLKKYLEYLT